MLAARPPVYLSATTVWTMKQDANSTYHSGQMASVRLLQYIMDHGWEDLSHRNATFTTIDKASPNWSSGDGKKRHTDSWYVVAQQMHESKDFVGFQGHYYCYRDPTKGSLPKQVGKNGLSF